MKSIYAFNGRTFKPPIKPWLHPCQALVATLSGTCKILHDFIITIRVSTLPAVITNYHWQNKPVTQLLTCSEALADISLPSLQEFGVMKFVP